MNTQINPYNSYRNSKRILFYRFTGFLVICCIFFVIPNLSNCLKDYTKSVGILESSRMNTTERNKGFAKIRDSELILRMQDGREWIFSEQYNKYWSELGNPNNVGKKYTIYSQGYVDSNPSQVEIENEIIYNLQTKHASKFLFILLTIICVIASINSYRKRKLREAETAGNSQ